MVSCRLERLKCFACCKAWRFTSSEDVSGLSVDEFQDPPMQFGQVLKAKNFNRCFFFYCW